MGTGKIARTALLGLNTLFSLEEIKVYDISENFLFSFIKDFKDQTNLKFSPVDSPEEAIQGSMSFFRLKDLWIQKKIKPSTYVWNEKMEG